MSNPFRGKSQVWRADAKAAKAKQDAENIARRAHIEHLRLKERVALRRLDRGKAAGLNRMYLATLQNDLDLATQAVYEGDPATRDFIRRERVIHGLPADPPYYEPIKNPKRLDPVQAARVFPGVRLAQARARVRNQMNRERWQREREQREREFPHPVEQELAALAVPADTTDPLGYESGADLPADVRARLSFGAIDAAKKGRAVFSSPIAPTQKLPEYLS